MALMSCSKSFIDAKSNLVGQPAGTSLWKTPADAQSAVNTIYGNLRSWNNVAFASVILENIPSDDAAKGSTAGDATFINLYDNFTVTATEGQGDGFWTGQYQNINFCNQVLDHVDTMSGVSDALKTRYLAEAKFIRAYSYFRLVRMFGRIPLIIHVPVTPDELNPKQNTPAEVYAQIESDLSDAASGLPSTVVASEAGRATQGAAWALHAKVAMYQKKWNDVLTYTNNVINSNVYSLFPNYYQLFRIANENNSESIFEIQCNYVNGNSDISNSQYSQVQGNRDANAGWGFNVPTQDLVNEFETGDPRLPATVMTQGMTTGSGEVVPMSTSGNPTMYNMKAYVPFSLAVLDNQGADQNIRVIRYAEVLLMNAEANNELGNTSAALASLEKVRARARGTNSSILPEVTITDQSALRTAIYHERRVELAMENDRYFDVIRQGRAATVFGPLGWKANKNEYWPIPQTEIDNSNGVLTQNPGY
ncbi:MULTISPECIES: RagB/SusD family nutrient uptake outer membrane protein [Chitinophagaceae]